MLSIFWWSLALSILGLLLSLHVGVRTATKMLDTFINKLQQISRSKALEILFWAALEGGEGRYQKQWDREGEVGERAWEGRVNRKRERDPRTAESCWSIKDITNEATPYFLSLSFSFSLTISPSLQYKETRGMYTMLQQSPLIPTSYLFSSPPFLLPSFNPSGMGANVCFQATLDQRSELHCGRT